MTRMREHRLDMAHRTERLASIIMGNYPEIGEELLAIATAYRADRMDDADRLLAYAGMMLLFALNQRDPDPSNEVAHEELVTMAEQTIKDLALILSRAAHQPSYHQPINVLLVLNVLILFIEAFRFVQPFLAGLFQ